MNYFALAVALASVVPALAALTANTPTSVVYCQPALLTWIEGTAPYYVTIIPDGQVSAAPLKSFPTQNGNQYTWTVDIAANTAINLAVKDSNGQTAYSGTVTVQAGTDSTCASASNAATTSAATSTASASSSAQGVTSMTSGASQTGTTGSNANRSGTMAAGNSQTTNKSAAGAAASTGAARNSATRSSFANYGLVVLVGLVGIALC